MEAVQRPISFVAEMSFWGGSSMLQQRQLVLGWCLAVVAAVAWRGPVVLSLWQPCCSWGGGSSAWQVVQHSQDGRSQLQQLALGGSRGRATVEVAFLGGWSGPGWPAQSAGDA